MPTMFKMKQIIWLQLSCLCFMWSWPESLLVVQVWVYSIQYTAIHYYPHFSEHFVRFYIWLNQPTTGLCTVLYRTHKNWFTKSRSSWTWDVAQEERGAVLISTWSHHRKTQRYQSILIWSPLLPSLASLASCQPNWQESIYTKSLRRVPNTHTRRVSGSL